MPIFSASWGPYCRQQVPSFKGSQARFRGTALPFVTVNDAEQAPPGAPGGAAWWALAAGLVACQGATWLFVAPRFAGPALASPSTIGVAVALQVVAGAIYLVAVRRAAGGRALALPSVLLVGTAVLLRLLALGSTPILEDDFNRYLWDGAVSASGLSPYELPPAAVRDGAVEVPRRLLAESVASGGVLARVNHPHLTTIYPPVAQAAFRLAHAVRPFSLGALRGVFLLFDAATALLLWALLREVERPPSLLLVYAWNPLFVRETLNAAHMDVVLVPFLLAAVLLRLRGRTASAAVFLALATGVKLWPVLLVPLLLAPGLRPTRKAASAVALYAALTTVLLFPMAARALEPHAGVSAYAGAWAMNGGAFPILAALLTPILGPIGLRVALAVAFAALALYLARTAPSYPVALLRRASLVPACLLLFGPTAYPWYFTWLLPFLALVPGPLLLLTATLPLYDLSFALERAGRGSLFHDVVVPLQWLPVWGAVAWAAARQWRQRHAPAGTGDRR